MYELNELLLPPQGLLLKLMLSMLGYDFCSPTVVSVPVTELTSELSCGFEGKALPAEGALQGLTPEAAIPSAFPTSPQIKLNKRMSHAGQRSFDMPCCISASSSIGADGSFNTVVTDEGVSMQQSKACCVHCSQNSVYR